MVNSAIAIGKKIPINVELEVVARANYSCEFCGCDGTEFYTGDTPVWFATKDNVTLLCSSCLNQQVVGRDRWERRNG